MATTKIDLPKNAWTLIGSNSILVDKKRNASVVVMNEDALPNMVAPEDAMQVDTDLTQIFPKPISGSWYAMSPGVDGFVLVTELV